MPPIELAEGKHELLLKNPDLGKQKKVQVVVTAGKQSPAAVSWDED